MGNLIDGDTLATLLNAKVDKVAGKSLIDEGFASSQSALESSKWLDAKTEQNNKVLEGINKNGEKYVSTFDENTKEDIRNLIGVNRVVKIRELDSKFSSPIPFKVYNDGIEDISAKGNSTAQYIFDLVGLTANFDIRFKFKITENIYNQLKSCVIARLGNSEIKATPIKLHQFTEGIRYDDNVETMYWNCLEGGVSYGESLSLAVTPEDSSINKSNIGNFAFSIQYVGSSHDVTIENNGTALVIIVDNVVTTLNFSEYETMNELFEVLKQIQGFNVINAELEGHTTDELAIFEQCKLVSLAYTGTDGQMPTTIEQYWDNAPFFVPYAIDNTWHQVEIVRIDNKVYSVCDGVTVETNSFSDRLILGGECGVLFKDLEISLNSTNDAELMSAGIISSVNPLILIFEGHGISTDASYEIIEPSNSLAVTRDRLQFIFGYLDSKGYIPVSINDVADYYNGIIELPKKCYVPIFDDTTSLVNCLDINKRQVLTQFGVKPSIAIISNATDSILYNGQAITIQQAGDICYSYGCSLISHTKEHRNCIAIKPSEYLDEFTDDFHSGDLKKVNGSILVYPYGKTNAYLTDCMKWLGYRLGILAAPNKTYNYRCCRKYTLGRTDLALRDSLNDLLEQIL